MGWTMIINIILIIVGFVLLIKGADFLVDGASSIAKRLHIPGIVIGLTVVSIGTSMPELFVSVTSALEGFPDMSIGNVVGSNIANLLLILGLTAIVRTISFKKTTIKYEIPFCLGTTILLFVLGNTSLTISRLEALVLLTIFIAFIIYTVLLAKRTKTKEKNEKIETSILTDIVFIALGVLGLKFGGDLTVENAVEVATVMGLSEKIISVTILAVGTSLPELVTSISAARKGETDLAIGNIIGSNIFNILLIVGVSALIKPITYNISYNRDLIVLLVSIILLLVFSYTKPKEKMDRKNGIIYFIGYIVYLIILFLI